VVLGNTTTLTEADRTFVERLASEELTQEEFRALLQAHRQTQVDNASLRQLIGLDTLGASRVLGRLRDRSMLELHRAGAQSYYTLAPGLLPADHADRGELPVDRGELEADRGELAADRGELKTDRVESLAPAMQGAIAEIGTRTRKQKLREVITQLCLDHWRTSAWLAHHLDIKVRNLVDRHLGPMVKDGTLERRFPDRLNHPEQAYRACQLQGTLLLNSAQNPAAPAPRTTENEAGADKR
jgi:ATP-dependent DNA helicase RecG